MNDNLGLHHLTFANLNPTDQQRLAMDKLRDAYTALAGATLNIVPPGPDRTYVLRKLRDCAMWSNLAIMRHPDGSPRS
jgi:hypothetical protein